MPSKTLALGAAMLGLAVAAPVPGEAPWGGWNPSSSGSGSAPSAPAATSPQPSGSAPSAAWSQPSAPAPSGSGAANGAQIKSGNPFSFPLDNGFPNLSAGAKQQVSILAHGIEPNGGAPTLDADDITSFQLIAFNEIFEVAFFTDLLFNVTNNVPGFGFQDQMQRQKVIDALVAIQAQEELHADNANAVLAANNVAPIQPCRYQFPTTNLADALALASTFTDVVLGTLQDVQFRLATNAANGAKTAGVVPIIGSVIGQEGEQNGFFRSYGGKIPSAKPFLTRSSREFAFSALNQIFVVPGSCPNSNTINLPVFQQLNVLTQNIQPQDQLITYSVKTDKPMPPSGVSLVLINGQEIPLVNPLQNVQVSNGVATFQAFFNFTTDILDGLTIAALTNSSKNADGTPFATAEDVAKVTIAGPGLIEIL